MSMLGNTILFIVSYVLETNLFPRIIFYSNDLVIMYEIVIKIIFKIDSISID